MWKEERIQEALLRCKKEAKCQEDVDGLWSLEGEQGQVHTGKMRLCDRNQMNSCSPIPLYSRLHR